MSRWGLCHAVLDEKSVGKSVLSKAAWWRSYEGQKIKNTDLGFVVVEQLHYIIAVRVSFWISNRPKRVSVLLGMQLKG